MQHHELHVACPLRIANVVHARQEESKYPPLQEMSFSRRWQIAKSGRSDFATTNAKEASFNVHEEDVTIEEYVKRWSQRKVRCSMTPADTQKGGNSTASTRDDPKHDGEQQVKRNQPSFTSKIPQRRQMAS